jgi:hypothetical protein
MTGEETVCNDDNCVIISSGDRGTIEVEIVGKLKIRHCRPVDNPSKGFAKPMAGDPSKLETGSTVRLCRRIISFSNEIKV